MSALSFTPRELEALEGILYAEAFRARELNKRLPNSGEVAEEMEATFVLFDKVAEANRLLGKKAANG